MPWYCDIPVPNSLRTGAWLMPGGFLLICRRWQRRRHSVTRPRARRLPLRLLSVAVLVVLAGVVAAAALTTRNVVRDQERLILRERTGEAADVLVSAFTGVQSSLQLLGVIAGSHQGDSQLFADAAHSVTTSATQSWLLITPG